MAKAASCPFGPSRSGESVLAGSSSAFCLAISKDLTHWLSSGCVSA